MTREPNIFFRVVREENDLTELLCNLLKYKAFRSVLGGLISAVLQTEVPQFQFQDVSSQVTQSEAGERPDIVIDTQDWIVVIENKVGNSGLTDAQRKGYAETLSTGSKVNKCLIFLLPESYGELMTVRKLVAEQNKLKVRAGIMYWADVLEETIKAGLPETNEVFADFAALLSKWFISKTVHFSEEGVIMLQSKEAGKAYCDTMTMIQGVDGNLSGPYKTKWYREDEGYGISLLDEDGAETVWLGIDFDFWMTLGYVLSIAIRKPRKLSDSSLVQDLVAADYKSEYWDTYGVPSSMLLQESNSRLLKDKIVAIHEKLVAAGNRAKRRRT